MGMLENRVTEVTASEASKLSSSPLRLSSLLWLSLEIAEAVLLTSSALSATRQGRRLEAKLAFCLLCLHAPMARICMRPACRAGLGAKGSRIVFPAHALIPPAASGLLSLLPAHYPLVAALQAHTRPGALPVTPFWPPYPKSLEGRGIMGPTQNWPLLMLFHWVLECPSWKGLGRAASPSPSCTNGSQGHKSELSFRLIPRAAQA